MQRWPTSDIVEVNPTKDNVEIINWHYLRGESLEQKKRQAIAEGGRILTLESAVGDTHNGLSSAGKVTTNSVNEQGKAQKANAKGFLTVRAMTRETSLLIFRRTERISLLGCSSIQWSMGAISK